MASAIVAYALVMVTSPNSGEEPTGTLTPSHTAQSSTVPPSTPGASSSPGTEATSTTPTAPETGSDSESTVSATPTTTSVPPPTIRVLHGSHVVLPAAWTGTATVTVAVLGDCAGATPSVYTNLPADLALDLIQNEANAAEVGLPQDAAGDDITLTLGINAGGVPSLAVYSSRIGENGDLQQYWRLALTPDGDRTEIRGTLINQSPDGTNPNIMVDAETTLQPCKPDGTVSLPRVLAEASTLSGWVSSSRAELTLHATTTDHRREVTVQLEAVRNP